MFLQNCLSSPNASIGDMVFQTLRTRFPLRIPAGMTKWGLLQEPLFICYFAFCILIFNFSSAYAWKLPLEVSTVADDGGKVYNRLVIGTEQGATEGFDNLWDTPALVSHPDPDNPVILRAFINGAGDGEMQRLWKDIREQIREGSTMWDITVDSVPEGKEIVVSWDILPGLLKNGERLVLRDNGNVGNDGQPMQVDVTRESDYVFVSGGEDARSLSLVLSKEPEKRSRSGGGSGFGCGTIKFQKDDDQPFNGSAAAGIIVLLSPFVFMRLLHKFRGHHT